MNPPSPPLPHPSHILHDDTICATATAPGGAIGIIRVSGPAAFSAVSSICHVCCGSAATRSPRTAILTSIAEPDPASQRQETIDEALVTLFPAPHSYTGEDSVEISCHGSPYILQRVLDMLCRHGCRMARPGEFTQRAYLNGKMDLAQAEAVADLIAAANQATHRLAMSQLRGGISTELATLREQLLKLTSLLELELDFSDHEDLEFADRTELLTLAETIDSRVTSLARTFETGQALKHGIPVAIVGKTNVGKSTLLNRLLHDDRAIVSPIHGTTRDTIEDTIDIRGVTFRFIDTAGLRQTADTIERIGIERTYAAIDKARIVIWLFDSDPTEADITDITSRCEGRTILPVRNKTDITDSSVPLAAASPQPTIHISAKTGFNIDALEAAIFKAAAIPETTASDVVVTSARQYASLTEAHSHLRRVLSSLRSGLSADLIAEDLRLVLSQLSEITGAQITPQETLNNIFSHFCVGK